MIEVYCNHCGGIALRGESISNGGYWHCVSCGICGDIDIGGEQDGPDGREITLVTFFARDETGYYCRRPDCDDCAEARKEAANG